jgi:F420-non-reducing hydrogenase iron-sulfur subunit
MKHYEPKLVCFSCKFGWGYLAHEEELRNRIKNWVPIICSGKIDTVHILEAFKQGADGVLVLGCPEGDCHYQDGNFEARKRVFLLQRILEAYGIEKERLKIQLSVDPEGNTIPQIVKEMSDAVAKLGPVRKTRDRAKSSSVARR